MAASRVESNDNHSRQRQLSSLAFRKNIPYFLFHSVSYDGTFLLKRKVWLHFKARLPFDTVDFVRVIEVTFVISKRRLLLD